MICDKGGAQTRTLREVYDFIRAQLNWLLENTEKENNRRQKAKKKRQIWKTSISLQ